MKMILSAIVGLSLIGIGFADEKIETDAKKVKVVPKIGVPLPVVRPFPGKYYWRHPNYGWGYWYYPAPVVSAPANYYIDEYGRVVPSGYAYDFNGNLVPLPAVAPYPYRHYYSPYWNRWGWR